jgi:hypothetical protein
MKITPLIYPVSELLDLVDRGRLALPRFQRDFVWRPNQVVELLHTVSRGWPAGSFLLLEGPHDFASRPLATAPPLTSAELLILDGQQRMTALYQAFRDEGDEVYFVDFDLLRKHGTVDEEDAIRYMRRRAFDKEYRTNEEMARANIAPVSVVADDARFFEWVQFVPAKTRKRYIEIRSSGLEGFKSYDIPVVRLPRSVDMGDLVRIFETVNRTGVRLAAFDLMVARVFSNDFHLADEWESAQIHHSDTLGLYDVDGIEILKTIALLEHLDQRARKTRILVKGVRESDVLAVDAGTVRDRWAEALRLYVAALEFVRDEVGATRPQLVPSPAMLLPIAAALGAAADRSPPDLRAWFWRSVVDQSYAQGANTQAVADARRLVFGAATDEIEFLPSPDLSFDVLFQSRRRNEILLRGVLCLLVRSGARDWLTNERLSRATGPLVVAPIFPRRAVAEWGGEADAALNLTIMTASTARRFRGKPPSEVVNDPELSTRAVRTHACDLATLRDDNWTEFAQLRHHELSAKLREAFLATYQ